MTKQRRGIGIFGGTFDPVHVAHLRMALEMHELLHLDHVRLIPSHRPPHRAQPLASSRHRVSMLQLAVQGCEELVVDTREIARDAPSYMVDTLLSLRAEVGRDMPLVLGMGADAFAALPTWHRWQQLFDLASIAVFARSGDTAIADAQLQQVVQQRQTKDLRQVNQVAAGCVVMLSPPLLDISATDIRDRIAHKRNVHFLLRDTVYDYIQLHHLYRKPSQEK